MSDCILWGGYVDPSGYGRIHTVGGRKVLAHRAAWEAERGAIPAGMCVMHKCDNPRCVNLDHLSLGTHADNMADRDAKGRTARLCGEAAPAAKLTWDQVHAIRRSEQSLRRAAAEYGVSYTTISKIRRGRTWAINPEAM